MLISTDLSMFVLILTLLAFTTAVVASPNSSQNDDNTDNSEVIGFFQNDVLKKVAIGVGIGGAVGIAAPVAIGAGLATAGFGAGGVVAGSVAAGIQSSIGSVVAGGLFGACQSIGAAGLAASTQVGILGATTGIGGLAAGSFGKKKNNEEQTNCETSGNDNDDNNAGENIDNSKNKLAEILDETSKTENLGVMVATSGMKIRLGNSRDFEFTNNVIKEHKLLKSEVLRVLRDLSYEAEDLVIEKIDNEMISIGARITGRGIIIGCGTASLFLLSNPVGATIGATGIVIGYVIVGGSKLYQMSCKRENSKKIEHISAKLTSQLNKYTESQNKIFQEMDMYGIFDSGKEFTENLESLRDVVLKAEKEAKKDFIEIEEFFSKLKRVYKSLNNNQKIMLRAQDFLQSTGKLFEKASQAKMGSKLDIGTGAASIALETLSAGPWWETIHGINILLNVGFIYQDIKQFKELYDLRTSWYNGDREKVLKNPRFENELKLRDLIIEIRDTMMTDGY